ncbi:MAG: mandelate racemase, partial [Phycisphaerales bacterium JB041]
LWALPEARALGYRGISIKSCKGVFGAVLNRARCDAWNDAAGDTETGEAVFQSGEDLTTLPVLALQQDLALMETLGVRHVERNGHHYFRGLGHLPRVEREAAVEAHGDLYLRGGDGRARLRIERGLLMVGSVLDAPGFGYAGPIDLGARTPAAAWDPDSLL